ncbi:expressed unknown protein [Seminavis robusta]|uniref:Uncharacterized protein n=1 Tax=Seminavis robusta TaxID=568900 RepID=A0A9N8H9N9_9STRA|nr:expressed unknown protein [Seminavis robusta]|eukprot:Sro123_g059370.1 n/a (243) ;mRNA; f:1418-2146
MTPKTNRDQHLLFEILQCWAGPDEEKEKHAKTLVQKHICLDELDPDFLTSTVLPSGLAGTQQVYNSFQIQALRAKEKYGRLARTAIASTPVWTSSGTAISAIGDMKTDLLKYPPIKIGKKVEWTIEILKDADNVWLGMAVPGQLGSKCCSDDAQCPGVSYCAEGLVECCGKKIRGDIPTFEAGSQVTLTLNVKNHIVEVDGSVNGGPTKALVNINNKAEKGHIHAVSSRHNGSVRFLRIKEI